MMTSSLPAALEPLADTPRWVAWRYERRPDGREDKVPVDPASGRLAQSNNPSTWGTFAEAACLADERGLAGVGIMLGDGLGGVDLDLCRDAATGELTPWAQKIIDGFRSYAEISPSGSGVKILAWGAPEKLPAGKRTMPLGFAGPHETPQVEAYVRGRFFTVTGDQVAGTPDEVTDAGDLGAGWDRLARFLEDGRRNGNGSRPRGDTPRASDGDLQRARDALRYVDPDDYDTWLRVGMALHHATDTVEARAIWDEWSARSSKYDEGTQEAKWSSFRADGGITLGTLFDEAKRGGWTPPRGEYQQQEDERAAEPNGVTLDDFFAYMPTGEFIFRPNGELWPAKSVDARVPAVGDTKASAWIASNRAVEQRTWAPGEPAVIDDRLIAEGGWIDRPGCHVFNLYKPPTIEPGDPAKATRWLDHVQMVFPAEGAHIITWFAHRVQRPGEKINHALVLSGPQGTGKDSIIEGAAPAVGSWNVQDVSPNQLLGRFNGFLKSVILRVSEARDLGDVDRYRLYEHLKTYTAAPPFALRVDEKHVREYAIPNVCGVVITSNHVDGIYLPPDDRRHFVAWTDKTKEDFTEAYWRDLYSWYDAGGFRHVAAYLRSLDLSAFNPKAPPPKTAAWWNVVDAGRAPEDAELADALDKLWNPEAVTLSDIAEVAGGAFAEWLKDRRNARQIPHRMEAVEYVAVRNDAATDGKWKIRGKRQVVYAKRSLSVRDRMDAAARLGRDSR